MQVSVFIFLVTLVLVGILDTVGESVLEQVLRSNEALAVFASALVGLIPNCSASVVITQLYLEGVLTLAPMLAGTLISAGVGYLVLFRTNRSVRENLVIIAMLFKGICSAISIGSISSDVERNTATSVPRVTMRPA